MLLATINQSPVCIHLFQRLLDWCILYNQLRVRRLSDKSDPVQPPPKLCSKLNRKLNAAKLYLYTQHFFLLLKSRFDSYKLLEIVHCGNSGSQKSWPLQKYFIAHFQTKYIKIRFKTLCKGTPQ